MTGMPEAYNKTAPLDRKHAMMTIRRPFGGAIVVMGHGLKMPDYINEPKLMPAKVELSILDGIQIAETNPFGNSTIGTSARACDPSRGTRERQEKSQKQTHWSAPRAIEKKQTKPILFRGTKNVTY